VTRPSTTTFPGGILPGGILPGGILPGGILPVLLLSIHALLPCCSAGIKGEEGLQTAADEARDIAGQSYKRFKILSEHPIQPGEDALPIPILLEEGQCYRIVAVRIGGASSEEVSITFQHSKQVIEMGTDFLELTAEDGELRNKRVVWGFCVWPSLVGELKVFNNLSGSGGYLLVIAAKAGDLSWKDGKDVKLYLKGTGTVDMVELERKEVEPKLRNILSKDHMNVPPPLEGKAPIFYEIINLQEPGWEKTFPTQPLTCYHFILVSLNCITQYKITAAGSGKILHDDGAPDDVGRTGWIQDFCLDAKHQAGEGTIQVKLKMISEEYDQYWFAAAIYGYEASKKEVQKLNQRVVGERKKVEAIVKKCEKSRSKCEKGCVKKEGKEKIEDKNCKVQCLHEYAGCTTDVVFEGELTYTAGEP
jgi:hypothetical protein